MTHWVGLGLVLIGVGLWGCSSEDKGTSVHCFDQKTVSLTAFTQTNCPTIADTVTNSPPTASGSAVSP